LAKLAAGQASAPGFLARFVRKTKQSVDVAAGLGVHRNANHGIRRHVELSCPSRWQL
jgi:hypothetical protein